MLRLSETPTKQQLLLSALQDLGARILVIILQVDASEPLIPRKEPVIKYGGKGMAKKMAKVLN